MRDIKELLILVRDNEQLFTTGLCYLCGTLMRHDIISTEEFIKLDRYIDKYPTKRFLDGALYYWPIGEWDPRRDWLTEHINKLNK